MSTVTAISQAVRRELPEFQGQLIGPDDTGYEEACKVLPLSSKASAALSRLCLQAILLAGFFPMPSSADLVRFPARLSGSSKA